MKRDVCGLESGQAPQAGDSLSVAIMVTNVAMIFVVINGLTMKKKTVTKTEVDKKSYRTSSTAARESSCGSSCGSVALPLTSRSTNWSAPSTRNVDEVTHL